MFTPDPCFNEPGYEGIKGTDEGDVSEILNGSLFDQWTCFLLTLKLKSKVSNKNHNFQVCCVKFASTFYSRILSLLLLFITHTGP